MQNYVCVTAKQRTATRYGEIISEHICPKLGGVEINELAAIELQKFVTELLTNGNRITGKGLSANAVNSVIAVLQGSLTVALSLGLIQSNPASKIKRLIWT